jgi:hypothetical protein
LSIAFLQKAASIPIRQQFPGKSAYLLPQSAGPRFCGAEAYFKPSGGFFKRMFFPKRERQNLFVPRGKALPDFGGGAGRFAPLYRYSLFEARPRRNPPVGTPASACQQV